MNDIILQKKEILSAYGIPEQSISNLIAGCLYYNDMQGVPAMSYWNESKPNLRDEFFLIVNTMFGLMNLTQKISPKNDWMTEYEVAFLIHAKTFSQNILSLDKLVHCNCYIDALVICRTILSRVNLLTLFSLNPAIYNDWLLEPYNNQYFDGNVRKELGKSSLPNFKETYKYLSGLIHGQFEVSAETGLLEKGLFKKIMALDNKIFTISKILLAMACYGLLSLLSIDQDDSCNEAIQEYNTLFSFYFEDILAFNKVEHLIFMIDELSLIPLEEENMFTITNSFDFNNYRNHLINLYKTKSK